jgi:hypothetical protein
MTTAAAAPVSHAALLSSLPGQVAIPPQLQQANYVPLQQRMAAAAAVAPMHGYGGHADYDDQGYRKRALSGAGKLIKL